MTKTAEPLVLSKAFDSKSAATQQCLLGSLVISCTATEVSPLAAVPSKRQFVVIQAPVLSLAPNPVSRGPLPSSSSSAMDFLNLTPLNHP